MDRSSKLQKREKCSGMSQFDERQALPVAPIARQLTVHVRRFQTSLPCRESLSSRRRYSSRVQVDQRLRASKIRNMLTHAHRIRHLALMMLLSDSLMMHLLGLMSHHLSMSHRRFVFQHCLLLSLLLTQQSTKLRALTWIEQRL